MPTDLFKKQVSSSGVELRKRATRILQVNMGKYCNLTCCHCHVESGPTKTRENMDHRTAEAVIRFLEGSGIRTLDLTGGAPELNPHFRYLVTEARRRGVHVMDRSNLTVLYEEGQEGLAEFLAKNSVEVVASLPCYSREKVDKQRGTGVFLGSIRALQWLNRLGYGMEDTGLVLNLVYNPVGAHLPPPQPELERDYRVRLGEDFNIVFNRLYTITNMPITRYEKYLKAKKGYDEYIALLVKSYNPDTLEGVMCRDTLSVGWDGRLYDCDFNQAIGVQARNGRELTIFNAAPQDLGDFEIQTGNHCFGCTAGAGSSCQGALQ